ncbi:FecCD family ABC transporter permease [Marinomonas mediterranea]|jgi:ABC-type Fe3+-siderophore transport system, permease component|uniref:ABC-type transporter, integral membrane subunit n=1 Tax=Marinomonas mediterranea (strain ATCC 700492 / JCM 21426 / NBRC 103028 / MMB-1) TaxID=717774 RepID=F2K3R5_MARM1|nr:iron ABC transporter permease [Marinomonas mediterranea]ADZ90164.1 ABC-type transporter, integral membrane subunit [Marinomonas mediterranea MMB-1]WCN08227.1 iron chelate uptake ABC transporter family permease subunit [Marinomonas mediterranea]WCN12294.1 iron chelate uptake ABC transporter family permease subunit [Marinomonas mediterranea]WCN16366.1 iron chelate uptake ABC transporter family permease subunit [Marinomonas mediterranea MMB-1]
MLIFLKDLFKEQAPSQRTLLPCFLVCSGLFVLVTLLSLLIGAGQVSAADALWALFGRGSDEANFVLFELRLPRTLTGIFVGIALGLSGALMQSLARNPLAEPGLLGVSAGASFAVALALIFGASIATLTIGMAQLGALLGCLFVTAAARMQGQFKDPVRLVLAGAALSSLLTALTSILLMFDERAADEIRFWVTGSIAGRSMDNLLLVLPYGLVALLVTLYVSKPLASMALGEKVALGLGHNPKMIRYLVILAVALLVGSATAVAGPIVFVGLVVPFAARAIVGADIRRAMIICIPLGPSLLLFADILTRLISRPSEMPLGVLTAIIGAPILLMIVRAKRLPTLS